MSSLRTFTLALLAIFCSPLATWTPYDQPRRRVEECDGRCRSELPGLPGEAGQRGKRVPDVLRPLHYHVRIQPYYPNEMTPIPDGKASMTFDGTSTFIFEVKNSTEKFTLHCADLNVTEVNLFDSEGNMIETLIPTFNTTLEHIILTPSSVPQVGVTYMLQFIYSGRIHWFYDGGLFYTSYKDENDKQFYMIATYMVPGFARSVFPCLDEPSYKAIFHLTLIYPTGLIALANMMERSPVLLSSQRGWSTVQYPPTPPMSTYLVTFAVGPFVNIESYTEDGILVRAWGWTGHEDVLDFTLNTATKCLYEMGRYFDFKFPLSKSDQLALPEFAAGAMENWGLVVYNYNYVLIHPNLSTSYDKQSSSGVVCHELSHQWFGNTVTTAWWDDVFLHEGFAQFLQVLSQQLAIPQQSDLVSSMPLIVEDAAFQADSSVTSHPVCYYDGPAFDTITYNKGASLLRMVRSVLGPDAFQEALRDYIASYKFSNADHEMLFSKFTAAASKYQILGWCGNSLNFSNFLDPWFLQRNFPQLSVTSSEDGGVFSVIQQPYSDFSLLPNSTYNYSWPVPIFSRNYQNGAFDENVSLKWLLPPYEQCGSERLQKMENSEVRWEMENVDMRAFARVQYDRDSYSGVVDALRRTRDTRFSLLDTVTLISDQIAFYQKKKDAGEKFSQRAVLDLLTAILPSYPHAVPFVISKSSIDALENSFIDRPDYPLFQKFMKELLDENYGLLYWNLTGNWDVDYARLVMLPYAVRYEIGDAVEIAAALFDQLLLECDSSSTGVTLCATSDPDLRAAIYCGGVANRDDSAFNKVLKLYHDQMRYNPYFYSEYRSMVQGMSCTRSQESYKLLINESLISYESPRSIPDFLTWMVTNPHGSDWMASYLLENPQAVIGSDKFVEYVRAMTSVWNTQTRLLQLKDLLSAIDGYLSVAQKTLMQLTYNETASRVDSANKYLPEVVRFLYDNYAAGPSPSQWWNSSQVLPLKAHYYDLSIQPFFNGSAKYLWYTDLTFEGRLRLWLTVLETTNEIRLHSHRILIDSAEVTVEQSDDPSVIYNTILRKDYDNGVIIFTLPSDVFLQKDTNWTLSVAYRGFIYDDQLDGVFLNSNYFEFSNQKAWIFTTYFETGPSARSLVPCLDEPGYKASWRITLKHPADMIALGNMPDQGSTFSQDGWATTVFTPSPPMSSYLLALAVGHFASLDGISTSGVLVRVWAWTGMERYAEHSLKVAVGAVDFMTEYANISYSLPKLDVLALPLYGSELSAMESWGLIQVCASVALVEPLYSSSTSYETAAVKISHEVVEQWFGNFVTAKTWSLVFLSKAFGSYYQANAVNFSFAEQKEMLQFDRFLTQIDGFIEDSSLETSRPVIGATADGIAAIVSSKGASLLHMLNSVVGEQVIQAGLQQYLREYAFSNADDEMLWAFITQAAQQAETPGWNNRLLDVKELMDPWMYQATFPVLKVANNAGTVTYSQEPFIVNATEDIGGSPYEYMWPIPIFSQTNYGKVFHYFIGENGSNEFWTRPFDASWQVDNAGGSGFYCVLYDDDMWNPIETQLKTDSSVFDEFTRARFLSDAIALQKRGSLSWKRILDMALLLSNEDKIQPFVAIRSTLNTMLTIFTDFGMKEKINRFVWKVIGGAYSRVGWQSNEDWVHNALASMVTDYACQIGNTECLSQANAAFKEFIVQCGHSASGTAACNSMDSVFRRTQYCYGLAQNPEHYGVVKKLQGWAMENSQYIERDNLNLLHALTCANNDTLLQQLISDTVQGLYTPSSSALSFISWHDESKLLLWNYFVSHINDVIYGRVDFGDYIGAATDAWNTVEDRDTLNEFLASEVAKTLSTSEVRLIERAVNHVQSNVDWLSNNKAEIDEWLTSNLGILYGSA